MYISDLESKQLNSIIEDKTINEEIKNFEEGKTVIKNIREAREIIQRFIEIVKSKDKELIHMTK